MYQVVQEKKKFKQVTFSDKIYTFPMASPKKTFIIGKEKIKNIIILNTKLAHPLISKKVAKEYQQLVEILMDLLTSDDDTGDSLREALNRIEKFRQEIKNKYRHFLKQQELEAMAKHLKTFQQQANKRFIELQTELYEKNLHHGKGK